MLEREQAFYESRKDEYLTHYEGQYVLIHGDEFHGAFTTERQAYEAAVARFGNAAVLIRKVIPDGEPVEAIPALLVGFTAR